MRKRKHQGIAVALKYNAITKVFASNLDKFILTKVEPIQQSGNHQSIFYLHVHMGLFFNPFPNDKFKTLPNQKSWQKTILN